MNYDKLACTMIKVQESYLIDKELENFNKLLESIDCLNETLLLEKIDFKKIKEVLKDKIGKAIKFIIDKIKELVKRLKDNFVARITPVGVSASTSTVDFANASIIDLDFYLKEIVENSSKIMWFINIDSMIYSFRNTTNVEANLEKVQNKIEQLQSLDLKYTTDRIYLDTNKKYTVDGLIETTKKAWDLAEQAIKTANQNIDGLEHLLDTYTKMIDNTNDPESINTSLNSALLTLISLSKDQVFAYLHQAIEIETFADHNMKQFGYRGER